MPIKILFANGFLDWKFDESDALNFGELALIRACSLRKGADMAEFLVQECKVNVNVNSGQPLATACIKGFERTVAKLVNTCKADISLKYNNLFMLEVVAIKNHVDVLAIFLAYSDISNQEIPGVHMAFAAACAHNNINCASFLWNFYILSEVYFLMAFLSAAKFFAKDGLMYLFSLMKTDFALAQFIFKSFIPLEQTTSDVSTKLFVLQQIFGNF